MAVVYMGAVCYFILDYNLNGKGSSNGLVYMGAV